VGYKKYLFPTPHHLPPSGHAAKILLGFGYSANNAVTQIRRGWKWHERYSSSSHISTTPSVFG